LGISLQHIHDTYIYIHESSRFYPFLDTHNLIVYQTLYSRTCTSALTHTPYAWVLVIKAYTENGRGEKETEQIILYVRYISCQRRNRDLPHTGWNNNNFVCDPRMWRDCCCTETINRHCFDCPWGLETEPTDNWNKTLCELYHHVGI